MNGTTAASTGRPVADAEFKFNSGGSALLTFGLAVEEHRQDGQASETQWVCPPISAMGRKPKQPQQGQPPRRRAPALPGPGRGAGDNRQQAAGPTSGPVVGDARKLVRRW